MTVHFVLPYRAARVMIVKRWCRETCSCQPGDLSMDVESTLRAIGKSHGYVEIKEKQRDAILAFVSGKDVFVSLPTGYGKSFCYQCLPLLFDIPQSHEVGTSIAVVVTPLAAIMKDHSGTLRHGSTFLRTLAVSAHEYRLHIINERAHACSPYYVLY